MSICYLSTSEVLWFWIVWVMWCFHKDWSVFVLIFFLPYSLPLSSKNTFFGDWEWQTDKPSLYDLSLWYYSWKWEHPFHSVSSYMALLLSIMWVYHGTVLYQSHCYKEQKRNRVKSRKYLMKEQCLAVVPKVSCKHYGVLAQILN